MITKYHLENKFRSVELIYHDNRNDEPNILFYDNKQITGQLKHLILTENDNLIFIMNFDLYINGNLIAKDIYEFHEYFDKEFDVFIYGIKYQNKREAFIYIGGEIYGPYRQINAQYNCGTYLNQITFLDKTFVIISVHSYQNHKDERSILLLFEIKGNKILYVKKYPIDNLCSEVIADYNNEIFINTINPSTKKMVYHGKTYKIINRVKVSFHDCQFPNIYYVKKHNSTTDKLTLIIDKEEKTFNVKDFNDTCDTFANANYSYVSRNRQYNLLCYTKNFRVFESFQSVTNKGVSRLIVFMIINDKIFGPFRSIKITYVDEDIIRGAFVYGEKIFPSYKITTTNANSHIGSTLKNKNKKYETIEYHYDGGDITKTVPTQYTFTYELGDDYIKYKMIDGSERNLTLMTYLFREQDIAVKPLPYSYAYMVKCFPLRQNNIYFFSITRGIKCYDIKDYCKVENISKYLDKIIKKPIKLKSKDFNKLPDIHMPNNYQECEHMHLIQVNEDIYYVKTYLSSISITNNEYYFFINAYEKELSYIMISNLGKSINIGHILKEQLYKNEKIFDINDACVLNNNKIVLIVSLDPGLKYDVVVVEGNTAKVIFSADKVNSEPPLNISRITLNGPRDINLYNNLDFCYINAKTNSREDDAVWGKTLEDYCKNNVLSTHLIRIE